MTLISSPKPAGRSAETDLNQKIACATWQSVSHDIIYFGDPQDTLTTPKVTFIQSEPYPQIFRMAQLGAMQSESTWVAVLNADIRLHPRLCKAGEELEKRKMKAAASYRWQLEKDASVEPRVEDNGLDFFMARPSVWNDVAVRIPKDLCMGAQLWDTWMLSYLATFQCEWYADLTPAKCVFHPKHDFRQYGPQPATPQIWSHPVMSPNKIRI